MSTTKANARRSAAAAVEYKAIGALITSDGATLTEMTAFLGASRSRIEEAFTHLVANGTLHRVMIHLEVRTRGERSAYRYYPISTPLPIYEPKKSAMVIAAEKRAHSYCLPDLIVKFIRDNPRCSLTSICQSMRRAKSTISTALATLAADSVVYSEHQPAGAGGGYWSIKAVSRVERDPLVAALFGEGPARAVVDYDALRMEA